MIDKTITQSAAIKFKTLAHILLGFLAEFPKIMRPKSVLFLQHGDTDQPGILAEVLRARGCSLEIVRPDLGQPIPASLDRHDGLAIGGGAQAVYEAARFPYLAEEIALIRQTASQGQPTIGLCLGGQLMAAALGGGVRRAPHREIGFFPVHFDEIAAFDPLFCGLPKSFVAAHWHGDAFEVPPGGMHLASSDLTPHQLFRYGHALYGLQFHLEMTPEILDLMVSGSRDELAGMGCDPDAMCSEARQHLPVLRETAATVFTRWAELL